MNKDQILAEAKEWLDHPYTKKFFEHVRKVAFDIDNALAEGRYFNPDDPLVTQTKTGAAMEVRDNMIQISEVNQDDLEHIFLTEADDEPVH